MFELAVLICLLGALYMVFFRWVWREEGAPSPEGPAAAGHLRESVLFVCIHNSARSQMAEALLREMAGERFVVASAGTSPTSVHPLAAAVMADRGLSLQGHRSKALGEMELHWDYVITLCAEAFEECPEFPAKTCRLHWSIEDPTRPKPTSLEQLEEFCRVRDELAVRLRRWFAEHAQT